MIKRTSEKMFPEEDPEFQVAPMIDILLVLMTFFMSITSTEILRTKTKLQLDLAVAKDSKAADKANKPSECVVNVGWHNAQKKGWIEIEEKELTDPTLITDIIIRQKGTKPGFFRAYIRCGENVPYSYTQQVLGACAQADVDNITFAVLSQEGKKDYGPSPTPAH